MKINNKGFTLIELLAVVIILLAISVIAISSISAAIERNKAKQNEAKIDIIKTYAKLYFDSYRNKELDERDCCIELGELDLSDAEKVNADGEDFEGVIKYTLNENKIVNNSMIFDNSIKNCSTSTCS